MSLLSVTFLLILFPAALLCFYAVPAGKDALRGAVLLCFSLLFVFLVQPAALAAVLLTCAVCYGTALALACARSGRVRRVWLLVGTCVCVGMLCVFKYAALFASAFGVSVHLPEAPAGISFFTFLAVSYLVDVYRGTCAAERDPARLVLYFTAFPKFLQGPLTRYAALRPQLHPARPDWQQAVRGAERMTIGMGKKLLLATAAQGAAEHLLSAETVSAPAAWLGAACYAWQIYFDFAGYTDLAIGLGWLFGLDLPENFRHPYCAQSVTDFWRRWHISLSLWFRDYVYIPLGGNRRGLVRQILNLLIVWALTGLWHGANWTFVLWGLYFALLLIAEKAFLGKYLQKLPRVLRHVYAVLCILFGWVIFQSGSMAQLTALVRTLFGGAAVTAAPFVYVLRQYGAELLLAALCSTPLPARLMQRLLQSRVGRVLRCALLLAVLALSLLALVRSGVSSFLYAQF